MCWERLSDREVEEIKGVETSDVEKPRPDDLEWPRITRTPTEEPAETEEELARV